MRFRLSTAIYWLVTASILCRLLLSSWLLDSWYPYSAEGGHPYYKIHPGSLLAFSGLALLAFVKGVPTLLRDLWRTQRPAVIFAASVVLVSLVSTLFHGISGAAYLVDTFLAAGCYSLLLPYVDAERLHRIATTLLAVVGANSVVAIAEYVGGFHLLPQPYSYGFFRASALFGHPLANGLLTAVCMFAALAMPWRGQVKAGYIALLLLSLFAFGARGALLVSAIALAITILAYPHVTRTGRRNRIVMLPLAIAGVALVAVAISGVLFGTEFGYTIASRMTADESTGARLASMEVVSRFSTGELMWGIDAPTLGYLLDLAGVPIVENFWVAMTLRLGVPMLVVLAGATTVLLAPYVRRSSFYLQLTLVVFFVVASTNNSLAAKSCALAVLVVLLAAIGRVPPRSGEGAR
jgi:hypothetical protein